LPPDRLILRSTNGGAPDGKRPYAETALFEKAPSHGFSARQLFIKDCAESVAVMAKSPAVPFGK
jgi:hypothetical protein